MSEEIKRQLDEIAKRSCDEKFKRAYDRTMEKLNGISFDLNMMMEDRDYIPTRGLVTDRFRQTCSMCTTYYDYEGRDECEGCPIFLHLGYVVCHESFLWKKTIDKLEEMYFTRGYLRLTEEEWKGKVLNCIEEVDKWIKILNDIKERRNAS